MALAMFGIDLRSKAQELLIDAAKPPDDGVPKPNFIDDPYYIVLPPDEAFYPSVENANRVQLTQKGERVDRTTCAGEVTCLATNLGGTSIRVYYIVRSKYNLVTYFRTLNDRQSIARVSDLIMQSFVKLDFVRPVVNSMEFSIGHPDSRIESYNEVIQESIYIAASNNTGKAGIAFPDVFGDSRTEEGYTFLRMHPLVSGYGFAILRDGVWYFNPARQSVLESGKTLWQKSTDLDSGNLYTAPDAQYVDIKRTMHKTRIVNFVRHEYFTGLNYLNHANLQPGIIAYTENDDLKIIISHHDIEVIENDMVKSKRNDVTWSFKNGFSDQAMFIYDDNVDVVFKDKIIEARFDDTLAKLVVKYDGQNILISSLFGFKRLHVMVWPNTETSESGSRIKRLEIL